VELDVSAGQRDAVSFVEAVRPQAGQHLATRLQTGIKKWQLSITTTMSRHTSDGEKQEIEFQFRSTPQILYFKDDIDLQITAAGARLTEIIDAFIQLGSGWTLEQIQSGRLHSATYNPIGGSSYIPTPSRIASTKAVVNVQNDD